MKTEYYELIVKLSDALEVANDTILTCIRGGKVVNLDEQIAYNEKLIDQSREITK